MTPMPPRIVRILTRLGSGGPPIHALVTTRGLTARGYPTTLVAGSCAPEDGDMSYLVTPDVNLVRIPAMSRSLSPWNDLKALWQIYRLLRRLRPIIVHTHTAKAGALGRLAALLARTPVVVHTYHGHVFSGYFSPLVNSAIKRVEWLLALFTDRICCLSAQQAVELSAVHRVVPGSRLAVIPLGMDLSPFAQLPHPQPGSPLTIGWLGRLVDVKNLPLLASIVDGVMREELPVRFLLAGDGPLKPMAMELEQRWGRERCHYLGWVNDVVPIVARCDLLLLTSHNEGTPVSLIQGMAAGRPFLSTAAGGVVDLAGPRSGTLCAGARIHRRGILVEPNPTSFIDAIRVLTAHPPWLAELSRCAAEYAMAEHGLDNLLDRLERLYRSLGVEPDHASAPGCERTPLVSESTS